MLSHSGKIILLVAAMAFFALQYSLWLSDYGLIRLWDMEKQVEAQHQINRQLEIRNQGLQAEVIDLKQGQEALEERARSQLGMIKEDEIFFQVIEENEE